MDLQSRLWGHARTLRYCEWEFWCSPERFPRIEVGEQHPYRKMQHDPDHDQSETEGEDRADVDVARLVVRACGFASGVMRVRQVQFRHG